MPRLLLISLFLLASLAQAQDWNLRICAHPDNLPYSNQQGDGFEDRIAELVGRELGAELEYVWLPGLGTRARDVLMGEGECDVVMGISDGNPGFLTTVAYYRSTYLFVQREDATFRIETFDDPDLRRLSIGVQVGSGVNPVTLALANRDLLENQVGLVLDLGSPAPLAGPIQAVVEREVDVAVVWGPVAGYFAELQPVELELVPVSPQIEPPFVPLVASISVGVRPGDEALRDRLNVALARRWEEIQVILAEYHVPSLPLPAPDAGGE